MSNFGTYPVERNLDGAYFPIVRSGNTVSLCFSDMTRAEQEKVIQHYNSGELTRLCLHLADMLRFVGDELDLHGEM